MGAASTDKSHSPREFLVTAFSKKPAGKLAPSKDIVWSEIWHADSPLPVGYPFRWVLQAQGEGVRLRDMGEDDPETVSHAYEDFSLDELERRGFIEVGDSKSRNQYWLRIQPVHTLKDIAVRDWAPTVIRTPTVSEAAIKENFKRISIGVAGTLALMTLVLFLIPKPEPKPEEIIPEEFAKVLLSPALKKTTTTAEDSKTGTASNNVVQAFQSEAIQKTTKSLFSSKAANALLSGSTLLNTAKSSEAARKIFDVKSALSKGAPGEKLEVGSKDVALVGGKGNYSSGGAAVEGQGTGQVSIPAEGVGVSEGLTKDEVGKVIREHMADVRYCYESSLLRSPGLEGKVVLSFTIASTGFVSKAKVKEASSDHALDQCVIQKLLKWKFPKPRGGVSVDVSYPFIFKSLGG